ncbi:MAG: hypothetical protein SFV19_04230 [Rhodospirillaceae bacterium]|nr:hypothetical protein [Rhodospirillaceae bacterium]
MTADRYTWLSEAAVARGYAAVIVEPALEWLTFPAGSSNLVPARYVTLPHALAALDYARAKWPGARKNIVAVGHSLGAAIVLELLDPQEAKRNPNNRSPSDFAGVDDLAAAIIIGTSLQAKGGSFELPYRSEDRSLHSPASTRLLFIAGENDGMATPQLMGKTAARYARPPRLEVVPGANHLNWSYGRGPMDRPDLDRPATISADQQIARTLDIMWEFLSH